MKKIFGSMLIVALISIQSVHADSLLSRNHPYKRAGLACVATGVGAVAANSMDRLPLAVYLPEVVFGVGCAIGTGFGLWSTTNQAASISIARIKQIQNINRGLASSGANAVNSGSAR